MKIEYFKPVLKDFLIGMMGEWFADKNLFKTLGIALIEANYNKFDNMLNLFSNENGEIDIEIINTIDPEDLKINLGKISPLLPNRTLLVTKEDLNQLYQKLSLYKQHPQME